MPSDAPSDPIERITAELRRPATPSPGFDERVMAAVRAETRPSARPLSLVARTGRWLVQPRTVRVSPLAGLATAAAVAGVLLAGGTGGRGDGREPARTEASGPAAIAVSARPAAQTVQFILLAPSAARVTVVGDFNDWNADATPLRPVEERPGVWSVQVPVTAGRHEYAFVVDGERWLADPLAPQAADDDFGTPNSVITVTERSS